MLLKTRNRACLRRSNCDGKLSGFRNGALLVFGRERRTFQDRRRALTGKDCPRFLGEGCAVPPFLKCRSMECSCLPPWNRRICRRCRCECHAAQRFCVAALPVFPSECRDFMVCCVRIKARVLSKGWGGRQAALCMPSAQCGLFLRALGDSKGMMPEPEHLSWHVVLLFAGSQMPGGRIAILLRAMLLCCKFLRKRLPGSWECAIFPWWTAERSLLPHIPVLLVAGA